MVAQPFSYHLIRINSNNVELLCKPSVRTQHLLELGQNLHDAGILFG
jgi:hypothetical protein